MDFYAIDFETANERLTSACSIGIVGIENDKIVLEESFLINPLEHFNDFNISIHNITPKLVQNAMTFPEVWQIIKKYFDNTIVFAHNASFDFKVLESLLKKYNLDFPTFHYGCTVKLSQKLWDKEVMINHKLSTVAQYLDIDFVHHDALEDARVCALIVVRALKIYHSDDVETFYKSINYSLGYFSSNRNYSSYKKEAPLIEILIKNETLINKNIFITGSPLVIKKKEVYNALMQRGCNIEKRVSERLDYFVVLNLCNIKKLREAITLIKKGCPIIIIDEKELLKIMELQ